jgi:hypothetical protein
MDEVRIPVGGRQRLIRSLPGDGQQAASNEPLPTGEIVAFGTDRSAFHGPMWRRDHLRANRASGGNSMRCMNRGGEVSTTVSR